MDPFAHSHLDPGRSPYASGSSSMPFRLDEGFSEDTSSQDEIGRSQFAATAARFQQWVMAQNEEDRAEIAYEVLRTLRTSNIAAVVERLTPLLHMDPLEKLPPEITAEIFSYLDARTLLTASLASRTWRARILDSRLWQRLFKSQGWGIDSKEIRAFENAHTGIVRHEFKKARGQLRSGVELGTSQPQLKKRATSDWLESRGRRVSADVSQWREQHGAIEADSDIQSENGDHEMQDAPVSVQNSPQRPNKRHSQDSGDDMDYYQQGGSSADAGNGATAIAAAARIPDELDPPFKPRLIRHDSSGVERMNWFYLFKQRQRLEENWTKGRYTNFQLPHPSYPHEAHTECIYTIQFFGQWLVSGSRDKTLRVWDLETRRLRGKPLTGHSQSVLCLQFDPTEQEDVIISGSSDASVIVWRFSTGQKIHEIPSAHEESVLNLRFDSRYLVTCSKDRRIKVWNRQHLIAADPDYPRVSRESSARVPSYIVNVNEMDPSLLEARMANGIIKSLRPYTLLLTLEGHGAAVNAIQINGDLIVSASGDRLIKVWNVRDGRLLRTLPGHQKGIACVQFDSKRIVSGSSDNTVRIYDPMTGAEVAELKGHTNLVRTVQAGFGDLPGSDEEDSHKARAAERKYREDLAKGVIVDDRQYRRRVRNGEIGSSRVALGSKLPPGGGGSKWGRIVSGSYDETIIIWRKNAQGDWVVGQTLRQESAVRVSNQLRPPPATQTLPAPPVPAPTAPPPPVPAATVMSTSSASVHVGPAGPAHMPVMSASQIVQQAMGTSFASLGAGISNVMGIARNLPPTLTTLNGLPRPISPGENQAGPSTNPLAPIQVPQQGQNYQQQTTQSQSSHHQPPQQQPQQQPQHQTSHAVQTPGPANVQPLPQPQQPPPPPPPQNHLPAHNPPQQHQQQQGSVSRVFKLQFDARRIVCCSQDSRIIGWDFANGDPDIVESCRFFVGP